jgi:hypothetical protein
MSKMRLKSELSSLLDGLSNEDLRTLRAIINGKLGKREITPEQQARMQTARKQKKGTEGTQGA